MSIYPLPFSSMKKKVISLLLTSILLFFSSSGFAHSGNVMIGFSDGLLHPVIGLDHLIAMISVGVISAQIGGFVIWLVPGLFVLGMLTGSTLAILIYLLRNINDPSPFIYYVLNHFADYIYFIIEFGIAFSVLFLGVVIFLNKKLPMVITSIIILIFGITHGAAHGLSIPYVIQPYLFILGFCIGTVLLHIFGVLIGYFSIKSSIVNKMIRYGGILISAFGVNLVFVLI